MSITRDQVADLQPGDVVSIEHEDWPAGTEHGGPLWVDKDGDLRCAHLLIRWADGGVVDRSKATLTVVSRAPRPLYVNSDRTKAVTGDVVGDAEPGHPRNVWLVNANDADHTWFVNAMTEWLIRSHLPDRLRLLVDGETGTAVTS